MSAHSVAIAHSSERSSASSSSAANMPGSRAGSCEVPALQPPHLGLRLEAMASERSAIVKNADMSEDVQQDAVDTAVQAMEKFSIEREIAAFIKKEFDRKYSPTWHCVVGRNFGSYVTHETKHFIYFYLGQVAILLFKSG
ncbi:hypothetical protein FNF27_07621 [Cafeteria roenbergensis]|uniref:Dynein light chain n=1 Tax=Cafeteria roenbergensis TaxID=33653 RepID=A0A5A8CKH3_CAFRO|nr:hypothetical protein FNF29_02970 [Cafeteria roenbergensis]KAA0165613.1 hypothetical protein FNF27_07621 [Cafeteria roenbergensis]|eukprot:KAA0153582.1 hypothetical protein FNF29_02970 [Cafeteria roenbergensis]